MAFAYGVDKVERLDARTLRSLWVIGDNGDALWPAVIAHLGDPLPLLVFLAAISAVGLYLGRARRVVAGVAAVACATVASQVLKAALAHPRVQPLYLSMEEAALPSGHATAAMALAVAAIIIAPRSLRVPTAVAGGLFALVSGISVVMLGWHYPSDVFAGYLVAVGMGLAALAALCAIGPEVADDEVVGAEDEAVGEGARPAAGLGLAALAGVIVVLASVRAEVLADYARDHTPGMVVAGMIALGAVVAVAGFAFAAREAEAAGA